MPSNDALIADLAGAILDGAPIDWASAVSSVDPVDRSMLEQLRVLSDLARHHRQIARSPPSDRPDREEMSGTSANGLEPWGPLRLLERIGGGEFGDVYRAWDPRLDREVALKLLRASSSGGDSRDASIIEEGRLLARVRHPNIVTIYGAERIGGRVGLWMELVNGRTLQQAVEQGKMFSPTEAIDIGIQLCQAIAAVHEAGLLHRDVKPQNAMLAQDGRIVLMDFGAGLRLDNQAQTALAGTPLYLAPELLRGEGPTVRSDIYSAGVVLFYLLTGSYPVRAHSLADLRAAHERREPIDIRVQRPDVPARFARAIARAIDPAPERRYQQATGFAEALAAVNTHSTWVRAAACVVITLTIAAGLAWRSAPGAQGAAGRSLFPGAAVSAVDRPIIAVLPFENLDPRPGSEYFAEGLTDEIIRSLAQVRGMDVRSRNSSARFGANPSNLRDLGEQLGANLVLGGSVLQSGQRLRINAQLTQISGNVVLWAGQFDQELKDLFVIQDDISRAIVNKLRLTLGRGQRRYDVDLDAYEVYLQARAMVGRQGASLARRAVALFEQVIAMDPSFAPAYAGLADAYAAASQEIPGQFMSDAISPDRALALMRPAAEKALQLDPLLADAHAAMGKVYARGREWQNADESFRRAIELNPSLSGIYTAYASSTLLPLGKFDEADAVLQTALADRSAVAGRPPRPRGTADHQRAGTTKPSTTSSESNRWTPDSPMRICISRER